MKTWILALALWPVLVAAQPDACSMSSRTTTQGVSVLKKVRTLSTAVVPKPYGWRECQAVVSAEHNNQEYVGAGVFAWADGRPEYEACAAAVQRAQDSIHQQVGAIEVSSRKSLRCNDVPEPGTPTVATKYAIGYVGELHEFPLYNHGRRPFSVREYPGSTCLLFLYGHNEIGGTICRTSDNRWVVVDIRRPARVQ